MLTKPGCYASTAGRTGSESRLRERSKHPSRYAPSCYSQRSATVSRLAQARRRAISARYRAALDPTLGRIQGYPANTVAHHAVVVTEARDSLIAHLDKHDVATIVHYPYLLAEMSGLSIRFASTPTAALLRDRILSLSSFPELSDEEVDHVVDALKGVEG